MRRTITTVALLIVAYTAFAIALYFLLGAWSEFVNSQIWSTP